MTYWELRDKMKEYIEKVYNERLKFDDIMYILSNVRNFLEADIETKSLVMSFKAIFIDNPTLGNKHLNIFRTYADIFGFFTEDGVSFDIKFSKEMPNELKEKIVQKGKKIIDKINRQRQIAEQIF